MRIISIFFVLIQLTVIPLAKATDELESPSDLFFEFKAGNFIPNVDDEFGGNGPFKTIFGDKGSILYAMQLDYKLFKGFGTLSIGGQAGFYWIKGNALLEDGTPSEDETALWLLPTGVKLTYRFDELNRRWNIPVVPFIKGGLTYTFWWITQGDGSIATFGDNQSGAKASGGTYGWEFSAGLALCLNYFDPASAKNLDLETGINASYIFVEWVYNSSDNFGGSNVLMVGGDYFLFGIGLEF
ncbi:MAG: hypothetical protein JXR95_13170 [Deltaproteobacteria bacterium]|nr:hypothetical protein [Deltaproteobacteria bacterium]